jgi:hypothetical protein
VYKVKPTVYKVKPTVYKVKPTVYKVKPTVYKVKPYKFLVNTILNVKIKKIEILLSRINKSKLTDIQSSLKLQNVRYY